MARLTVMRHTTLAKRAAVVLALFGIVAVPLAARAATSGDVDTPPAAQAAADPAVPADPADPVDPVDPNAAAASADGSTAVASTGGSTVVVAAGDIAEEGQSTMANALSTGDLVREIDPAFVLALGDNAYNDGSGSDYQNKYDPTWGSFKSITKPIPGNHEWHTSGAGYFDYFFDGSNVDWYAYDIDANWRAYALSCEVDCAAGSEQQAWFQADLAAHPGRHYVAYTHEPRYTSSSEHSDETDLSALYDDFVAAGGDIWLSGHNHTYERFAKMDGDGRTRPDGVRTFVVGTGGNQLYGFEAAMDPGQEFRQNTDYGVLKLTLTAGGYDWAFVASGRGYVDGEHVDTGRRDMVLDSGHETTNNTPVAHAPSAAVPAPTGTTPAPTAATETAGTALPSYIINSHDVAAADRGFNLLDVSPGSLDELPAGTRAMVWLGDLRDGCAWDMSDDEVSAFVAAHRGDPRIFAYYIADEPDDVSCAKAAATVKARTDLIHGIDPAARTYAIITEPPTFTQFAAAVDLPAIDPYPCRQGAPCDMGQIASYVDTLKAGLGDKPWFAVIQAFSSPPWRWPTAAEGRELIAAWCAAGPSGFTTFAWDYDGNSLSSQPELLAEIEKLNRGGCAGFSDRTGGSGA